jgi:hypothetical protein
VLRKVYSANRGFLSSRPKVTEIKFGSVHVALIPRSSRASHLQYLLACSLMKSYGLKEDLPGQELPTGDTIR